MNSSGQAETLFVCHECDAIQQVYNVRQGYATYCACCGAHLFTHPKGGIDTPLALIIASMITFIIANFYPLMTLSIAGVSHTTTLFAASLTFIDKGEPVLALLVFCTVFIVPVIMMSAVLYVLLSIRFDLKLPFTKSVLVWVSRIQPWGMMDVFLLGIIVSFVKLVSDGDVIFGIGFYAFASLIILYAGAMATLEPYLLWQHLDEKI